jgi:hypothetical protein
VRTFLAVAVALLAAPPASAAQYWYYCEESQTYYPYVTTCKTPWQAVLTDPEVPGQRQFAQERKPGQTKQEAERQARLSTLIECIDKVQRPLLFRGRETERSVVITAAVDSCGRAAPEGVSKKDVAETAASNVDRLRQRQRAAAFLDTEPVGTHPMPAIQNSPEALCDAPVAGQRQDARNDLLRSCTDQEFEKLREQMRRIWVLTPDWIQAECQTNFTFPNLFTCVQDWTAEWLAAHPAARTPWVRPDLGDVPSR